MTDYVEIKSVEDTVRLDVAASTTITKGQWVSWSSGVITCATNGETEVLGVALETVDNSSGSKGDEKVNIAQKGTALAPTVVEATDTNAFDAAITPGDALSIGGDGGTNIADGQGLVDGINASGTDQQTDAPGLIVATALESLAAGNYDSEFEVKFNCLNK